MKYPFILSFFILHHGVAGQSQNSPDPTFLGIVIGSILGGVVIIAAVSGTIAYICYKNRQTPAIAKDFTEVTKGSVEDTAFQTGQSNATSSSSLPFPSEQSISSKINENVVPSVNTNSSIQRSGHDNTPHLVNSTSSSRIQSDPFVFTKVTAGENFYHSSLVVPTQNKQLNIDLNERTMYSNPDLRPQEARSRHSWAVNNTQSNFDARSPYSRDFEQIRLPSLHEGDTSFSLSSFHNAKLNENSRPVEMVTQGDYMQQRLMQQRSRFSLAGPSPQNHLMKVPLPGMVDSSQTNIPLRKAMTLENSVPARQLEKDVEQRPYPARRPTNNLSNENEVYRIEGPLVISNAFNFLNDFGQENH